MVDLGSGHGESRHGEGAGQCLVIMFLSEFVKATIAYKNKVNSSTSMPQPLKLDGEMEMKRKKIVRSFSIARNIYSGGLGSGLQPIKEFEVEAGAEFLELGIVAGRGGRERTMDLGVKKSWAAAMEFERLSFS
ncbi:hypothetical protein CerSpe_179970 [Prunus speciosa]